MSRWIFRTLFKRRKRRSGQSMTEFAILLPVLLIMISGLIEFGFALNIYLDLIDAAREVARQAADDDSVHDINGNFCAIPVVGTCGIEPKGFYDRARDLTNYVLNQAGQISLGPNDDLVISTFSVQNGTVINRFPPTFNDGVCEQGGEKGWRNNCLYESKFSFAEIQTMLDSLPDQPPDIGLVLIEVYHDHHMVLALPWITTFVPDTLTLHAYSIMPNRAAAP